MYIATTTLIVRTKKPLFTLVAKKDEKKEDKKEEKKAEEVLTAPLPTGIPTELRGAFLRARQNVTNRPESAFDMKDLNSEVDNAQAKPAEDITPEPEMGLPIPDNFDFSAPEEPPAAAPANAPVFKEISFGGSDDTEKKEVKSEKKTPLIEHLEKKHYDYVTDGNAVIANGLAITTHADSDFWIADNKDWFAAGKQKASPVSEALAAASKHNVAPAIYLAEKNIMDIDNRIADWESAGVTVFTDLTSI